MLRLAGKASIRRRPVNSALGLATTTRMLSERKQLLRLLELTCLAASTTSLAIAYSTWLAPDKSFPTLLWGAAGMVALMLTLLPACMLGGEYVKTVKKPNTWRHRTEGLNSTDLAIVLRWAPALYKVGAAAAVLILVAAAIFFGKIKFVSDSPIDPKQIPGMFLYLAAFFLLALPVLGSASRMPGSYAANSEA